MSRHHNNCTYFEITKIISPNGKHQILMWSQISQFLFLITLHHKYYHTFISFIKKHKLLIMFTSAQDNYYRLHLKTVSHIKFNAVCLICLKQMFESSTQLHHHKVNTTINTTCHTIRLLKSKICPFKCWHLFHTSWLHLQDMNRILCFSIDSLTPTTWAATKTLYSYPPYGWKTLSNMPWQSTSYIFPTCNSLFTATGTSILTVILTLKLPEAQTSDQEPWIKWGCVVMPSL